MKKNNKKNNLVTKNSRKKLKEAKKQKKTSNLNKNLLKNFKNLVFQKTPNQSFVFLDFSFYFKNLYANEEFAKIKKFKNYFFYFFKKTTKRFAWSFLRNVYIFNNFTQDDFQKIKFNFQIRKIAIKPKIRIFNFSINERYYFFCFSKPKKHSVYFIYEPKNEFLYLISETKKSQNLIKEILSSCFSPIFSEDFESIQK